MSGASSPRVRPRFSILIKLLAAFTLPTAALFALFAALAYEVAREDLEAELGTRLTAVAASAATQIRGKYLVNLSPGQEEELFFQNAQRKLTQVMEATGVARIYVFNKEFSSRVDTRFDTAIGSTYFQARLDQLELERVFERGERASSLLFRGQDGLLYKAGYAPVYADPDKDETVVLAVGVDAPATFFNRLEELKSSLIIYGALLAVAIGLVSVLVATLITRPLRRLTEAATRIGRGDLAAAIIPSANDEIGFLARTMETMRTDLSARDQRLQLMLAGIAHEVRNPLGGMELFTGILRDELPADDARLGHVKRIDRELNHLKRVVNEFLDYARRATPELVDLDLGALAREVCELERGEAEAVGVELSWRTTSAPCRADEGQLRRVLLNLIRNARQAAASAESGPGESVPGARRVEVEVGRRGASVRFSVKNTGAPIPDEVRAHMFEPFFTTREKGTGLGLAFAREIINDHGGTIEVESEQNGARFTVKLPGSAEERGTADPE